MTDRIRILRVITRLNVGGPTRHVLQLARLPRERFEQVVVAGRCPPGERELEGVEALAPIRIGRLSRAPSLRDDLAALRELRALVRDVAPDIVHSHQAKAGALARLAASGGAVRRVHTFHGHTFSGYWGRARSLVVCAAERALAARSDRLVAQSEGQAEELGARLGRGAARRLVVIPPGVDLESLGRGEPVPRPAGGPLRIGFLGRLAPVKDPGLFLETAAELAARGAAVEARVGGDGEAAFAAGLRAQAQDLGIAGALRWCGWVDDVAAFLRDLDVLVLTSRNEGTPLVLLEALWCGCAVATTEVGGAGELVRPFAGAVAARARTPHALADAVLAAQAARRGPEGLQGTRDELERRHGTTRLVRDVAALYEGLVAEGRGESDGLSGSGRSRAANRR